MLLMSKVFDRFFQKLVRVWGDQGLLLIKEYFEVAFTIEKHPQYKSVYIFLILIFRQSVRAGIKCRPYLDLLNF